MVLILYEKINAVNFMMVITGDDHGEVFSGKDFLN